MKKIFKRGIAAVCSLVMLASIFSPLTAKANVINENDAVPFIETEHVQELASKYSSIPQFMDEDTVFLPLSEEENVNYIADTQNISQYEAKQLILERDLSFNVSQNNEQQITPFAVTYEDQVGIVLKRFNVYTGIVHACTIAATINVRLRQYSDSPTNRRFMEVYSHGVSLYSSSLFMWSTTSSSAVILSNGHLKLNASGNVTATVDKSLTLDLEAAGFSIFDLTVGSTYYVTKFVIFDWDFDPTYPGAILN
jgi:hypothetical protein